MERQNPTPGAFVHQITDRYVQRTGAQKKKGIRAQKKRGDYDLRRKEDNLSKGGKEGGGKGLSNSIFVVGSNSLVKNRS